MYFDHAQAAYENKCKEQYEKLKENLSKSNSEEDEMLYRHILHLEGESQVMKTQVEGYKLFFQQLGKLIPRQNSIHDVIG